MRVAEQTKTTRPPRRLRPKRDEGECAAWPRITRFYGIGPTELADLPRWLVEMYHGQIEDLEAAEQMLAIEAASFAHMKKSDADGVARRYRRILRRFMPTSSEKPKPKTPEQAAATARGMGISFDLPEQQATEREIGSWDEVSDD